MKWLFALLYISLCVYAVPTLLSADTMDVDSNGKIDHIRLTFSENMMDSSFNQHDWSLTDSYLISSLSTKLYPAQLYTANDAIVYLGLVEQASGDTSARPSMTYTQNATMSMGSQLLAGLSVQTNDKSPPVVMAAQSAPGLKVVRILMSEPVYSTTTDGLFNSSDFLYTNQPRNGTSTTVLSEVTIDQGAVQFAPAGSDLNGTDGILSFNADVPLEDEDFGGDTVTSRYGRVLDQAGNLAAFHRLTVSVNTALVESEETVTLSRETIAISMVFLVLVAGFMIGSLWWWCSRRGEGGSIPDDGTNGDGSVPDSRKPGRKQSIPLGSPEHGTDITVSHGTGATGGSAGSAGSGGSAGTTKQNSLTPQEVLHKYDANHDGVIDKQELMEIIKDARLVGDEHNQPNPNIYPAVGSGGPPSPVANSPPPLLPTQSMIANEHNRKLLREDEDEPKPSDDGVSDIKFDL